MTDDTDGNRPGQRSVTGPADSDTQWTKADWESLAGDPDLRADLGYDLSDWEQFETLDGTDQVMFLPSDESEIRDAAFVVADEELHLDLANHC